MIDVSMDSVMTMRSGGNTASLGRIDQYEIIRELGGGGFGTVYLAKDTVSGVDVAVKGLPPLVKNNKEELENIRRNFALVSRLHHPGIAAALVLHPASKVSYSDKATSEKLRVFAGDTLMVMEYAPGVTLSQWRRQFPDNRVPMNKAIAITRQIAEALDYAHERKIIHRDIKPSNIMIETSAEGVPTARVLDFGLAAEIRSSMGRVSQEIHDTSGTRPYMAPEQWSGDRQGPTTDQYALAVLFYELIVGEVPFASVFDCGDPIVMLSTITTRPAKVPDHLPKVVRNALGVALEKGSSARFESCRDFVAALEGEKKARHTGATVGVRRKWLMVSSVVFVLILIGVLFGWYRYRQYRIAEQQRQARIEEQRKADEAAAMAKADAEKKRLADEAAAKEASERKLQAEAAEKKRQEEAAAKAQKEKDEADARAKEDAERKRVADIAEKKRQEEVSAAKRKAEEDAAAKKKADEDRAKAQEDEIRRRVAEELEKQRREEERKKKQASEETAQRDRSINKSPDASEMNKGPQLSAAAKRLIGSWSCQCTVEYKDSMGSRADDTIKKFLPVSSTIRLKCEEDGAVELSDSSGRTFARSSGRWKFKHGMLIMDLKADDGRVFRLSGLVNWRGSSFELHYDNGEFANMIRKSCVDVIPELNAVLSSYVDGELEVSISTKAPAFKSGTARCSAHVFVKQ